MMPSQKTHGKHAQLEHEARKSIPIPQKSAGAIHWCVATFQNCLHFVSVGQIHMGNCAGKIVLGVWRDTRSVQIAGNKRQPNEKRKLSKNCSCVEQMSCKILGLAAEKGAACVSHPAVVISQDRPTPHTSALGYGWPCSLDCDRRPCTFSPQTRRLPINRAFGLGYFSQICR